jgi:NnrU protein
MLSLVLGAICFAGIHLGVAGTTLRDRAIAALGEGAYRAVFSIVSLVAIVWLVMAYKNAPYVATWGSHPGAWPFLWRNSSCSRRSRWSSRRQDSRWRPSTQFAFRPLEPSPNVTKDLPHKRN